jgi:hypothetical protein
VSWRIFQLGRVVVTSEGDALGAHNLPTFPILRKSYQFNQIATEREPGLGTMEELRVLAAQLLREQTTTNQHYGNK